MASFSDASAQILTLFRIYEMIRKQPTHGRRYLRCFTIGVVVFHALMQGINYSTARDAHPKYAACVYPSAFVLLVNHGRWPLSYSCEIELQKAVAPYEKRDECCVCAAISLSLSLSFNYFCFCFCVLPFCVRPRSSVVALALVSS